MNQTKRNMLAKAIYAATKRTPTWIVYSEDPMFVDVEIVGRTYRAYLNEEDGANENWYFAIQGDHTGVRLTSFTINHGVYHG